MGNLMPQALPTEFSLTLLSNIEASRDQGSLLENHQPPIYNKFGIDEIGI